MPVNGRRYCPTAPVAFNGQTNHVGRLGTQYERRHPHRRFLRATPVFTAASLTAAATAGTTRGSNMDGVMYSSLSSFLLTMAASAWAAASFISSFTRRARTSSIPRKKPGKQHELLIWFG